MHLCYKLASFATDSLTEIAKRISLEAAKRSAIISKEIGIQLAGAEKKLVKQMEGIHKLQGPLSERIVKAQVQSKLMWLKVQGKEKEYKEYERAATEATQSGSEGANGARPWKARLAEAKEKRKMDRGAKKGEEQKHFAERLISKKTAKKGGRAARKEGRMPT